MATPLLTRRSCQLFKVAGSQPSFTSFSRPASRGVFRISARPIAPRIPTVEMPSSWSELENYDICSTWHIWHKRKLTTDCQYLRTMTCALCDIYDRRGNWQLTVSTFINDRKLITDCQYWRDMTSAQCDIYGTRGTWQMKVSTGELWHLLYVTSVAHEKSDNWLSERSSMIVTHCMKLNNVMNF